MNFAQKIPMIIKHVLIKTAISDFPPGKPQEKFREGAASNAYILYMCVRQRCIDAISVSWHSSSSENVANIIIKIFDFCDIEYTNNRKCNLFICQKW